MQTEAFRKFSFVSAVLAFFLIFAGGMVTSTGSGLAVPDWPLSYGRYFPPMTGGVLFEHGHRMIAAVVAAMTWTLAVWSWLRERRRWVRLLATAAALGIAAQAVLGGITVLYGLPPAVSSLHACLGQALFCALVALWEAGVDRQAVPLSAGMWVPGAAAFTAFYLQLTLGAVLRHTGLGLAWHLAGALLAGGSAAWLVRRSFKEEHPALAPLARAVAGLFPLQLLLGALALVLRTVRHAPSVAAAAGLRGAAQTAFSGWWHLAPSAMTALHVACGAVLLAVAALWTVRALRLSGRLA